MASDSGLSHGLREQIVDQLRSEVLSGRLAVGERLSEASLVGRFKVSRTPIREALQQLTYEGLLDAKPNCGVRVASEPSNALRELIIPVRRTVETFALQAFFDTIEESDFRQWEEILHRMEFACKRRDYTAIAEQDLAFHRSIIRRAGMPELEGVWSVIVSRVRTHFRETQRNYVDPIQVYEEHAKIIETFRSGDREASLKILGDNIE